MLHKHIKKVAENSATFLDLLSVCTVYQREDKLGRVYRRHHGIDCQRDANYDKDRKHPYSCFFRNPSEENLVYYKSDKIAGKIGYKILGGEITKGRKELCRFNKGNKQKADESASKDVYTLKRIAKRNANRC